MEVLRSRQIAWPRRYSYCIYVISSKRVSLFSAFFVSSRITFLFVWRGQHLFLLSGCWLGSVIPSLSITTKRGRGAGAKRIEQRKCGLEVRPLRLLLLGTVAEENLGTKTSRILSWRNGTTRREKRRLFPLPDRAASGDLRGLPPEDT